MHSQQQPEENEMLAGAQTFGGNQMRNWLYDAATSKWNTPEIASCKTRLKGCIKEWRQALLQLMEYQESGYATRAKVGNDSSGN